MTAIIGFSGRQVSGKSTSSNFLLGYALKSKNIVQGGFKILPSGQLWITDIFGDTAHEGVFDVYRPGKAMKDFLAAHLDKYFKIYSFADVLKQQVCIKLLGLSHQGVYGSDEDKSQLCHLRWENLPYIVTDEEYYNKLLKVKRPEGVLLGLKYHAAGPMTNREVMEETGTGYFRYLYTDSHAKATINQIHEDRPEIAIICDVRGQNEVSEIHNEGGKVIRLTRNPNNKQSTIETQLDEDKYDWSNFDFVIDNKEMELSDLCKSVYGIVSDLKLGIIDGN